MEQDGEYLDPAKRPATDDGAGGDAAPGVRGRLTRYEIVPATQYHVVALAATMREADVREVWAASRNSPYTALRRSLEVCPSAKTGLVDGRVLCMFGVSRATALSIVGVPWMLGTSEIEAHSRAFLRHSRRVVEDMRSQGFSVLGNFVDARNTHAVEWLRWLGFTVNPAVPYGPFAMPFHPFVMECDNV